MRYAELVGRVAERGGLTSDDAWRATDATVAALGRLLSAEQDHNLASQLPRELRHVLRPQLKGSQPTAQPMGRDEFLRHMANRADIPLDQAEPRTRAVFQVLRSALTDGEWAELRRRFPESLAELAG